MEAAERIEVEAARSLCASPPGRMLDIGDALCVALPVLREVRMVNRGLGITSRTTDAQLDEMEAFFRDLGVLYQLVPAEPGLENRFAARGLAPGHAWMKFTRGIEATPEGRTDLRVARWPTATPASTRGSSGRRRTSPTSSAAGSRP
jgi:hypothetical protein